MLIGFDASRAFVDEPTGTENYSLNLLKALAKIDRKNRYRVYLRQVGKNPYLPTSLQTQWPKNFEFRLIAPSRLWTQVGLALETWRSPVDVLFVPAHTLPVLRNPKVKTVVTIHDLGVEYLPQYHQFPQKYYLDLASKYASRVSDAIIAVSAATKVDLVRRYRVGTKKISVVPEAVDTRFFNVQSKKEIERIKKKYKISDRYFLFVGTIQPRKNLEMLIEAFSLLVNGSSLMVHGRKKSMNYELSTMNLIIVGKPGWNYQSILSAPKRYGVSDKVKFLGRVENADLPALYSGASVFCFPSLFEGFGLPILEALSCGCLVIASDIAPHREIFQEIIPNFPDSPNFPNSVPIVLAKPKSVDQWSQFLYQSITNGEKRADFSNIRKILNLSFTWKRVAKETLATLAGVLE